MNGKKIVFLYSELAGYFLCCIKELQRTFPDAEIHIFRFPLNKEAPFDFNFPKHVKFYSREKFDDASLKKALNEIRPDLIYCSGWMDKSYVNVCKDYKGKIPTIVGLDNQWSGSLKQRIRTHFMSRSIRSAFSHCWVPGARQKEYALRLGFDPSHILDSFYCADQPYFNSMFRKYELEKKVHFPRKFIYVGRYVNAKGVQLLWDAFLELKREQPNDWELWCLGVGDIEPVTGNDIHHFGFIQPDQMERFIRDTGVFVLPSRFEPWGVVVHEFSSAGFPLICSSSVGASDVFIEQNINGYVFNTDDKVSLKKYLSQIISKTDEELFNMGVKSAEFSFRITPEKWVQKISKLL